MDDSPEAHGNGKIHGGGMVGTHAGDMIGEIALAIEMGADAIDIGKTIHPHPTLHAHRHFGREHACCVSTAGQRAPAHDLWAVLIARIYGVFPLLCPLCGGQMRLIAFITHSADIRQILDYIGAESEPAHIAPARGPPLWEDSGAQMDEGAQSEPQWDLSAQPAPDYKVNQRVNG